MFARIAFPAALPEALTYAVGDDLAGVARPGVRALVKLRGRRRVGIVVGLADSADCSPERVLPIDEVLDPAPLLPQHVLDLIEFVASYYCSGLGLVVRTAIPSPLLRIPPPMVHLGPLGYAVDARCSAGDKRLLERVRGVRRITVARLLTEGWDRQDLADTLARLAQLHAIKVVERVPGPHGGATVNAVILSELRAEERQALVAGAPAQQRLVAYLEGADGPVLESDLVSACRCSPGVVRALAGKGVVQRFPQLRATQSGRWELAAPPVPARLTAEQSEAVAALEQTIGGDTYAATLLHGVTGSGKTEVYLRLIAKTLETGRQALVLVPEIGLTPALAGQLSARFAGRVGLLHSSLAEGERMTVWERARHGQVDVVAGPRSALWAPLASLGLVVVDEEQDSSYKQDEEPRYNARDLALVVGQKLRIPVVLVSATPSLESLWLARSSRLSVQRLHSRVGGGTLPEVEVVDLRHETPTPGEHGRCLISRRLSDLLGEVVSRGEQAIVLVNRRGWAPVLLCRECGHQASCSQCSVPMTVHRRSAALLCHYCGARRAVPGRCARCDGDVLEDVGAGTEKVAERLRSMLEGVAVEILDRDTVRSAARLVATLTRFSAGDSQVLVGTQMVSKGHHFPGVTLTAVISADNLIGYPDFRAAEWSFQMLTQTAGRAGRGELPGRVVVQTYNPEHHAIQALLTDDADLFVREELQYRRAFSYPPCARMALIRCESAVESAAVTVAEKIVAALRRPPPGVRVIGPAPAPLARLRGKWRVQVILLAPIRGPLREALATVAQVPIPRGVKRVIDVDPQSTV